MLQLINKLTALSFTQQDEDLVRAFSAQIAIAIENCITYEQLSASHKLLMHSKRQVEELLEVAVALTQQIEFGPLCDAVQTCAARLADASFCELLLVDGTSMQITQPSRRATLRASAQERADGGRSSGGGGRDGLGGGHDGDGTPGAVRGMGSPSGARNHNIYALLRDNRPTLLTVAARCASQEKQPRVLLHGVPLAPAEGSVLLLTLRSSRSDQRVGVLAVTKRRGDFGREQVCAPTRPSPSSSPPPPTRPPSPARAAILQPPQLQRSRLRDPVAQIQFLSSLSNNAALALESIQLFELTQRGLLSAQQSEARYAAAVALWSAIAVVSRLPSGGTGDLFALAKRAAPSVAAAGCVLWKLDARTQTLFTRASARGADKAAGATHSFPTERGVLGLVARSGASANLEDMTIHPNFDPAIDEAVVKARNACVLAVPVLDHCNQVIGVLQAVGKMDGALGRVADAREPRRFTEHDARFLALFCSQLASAIEHISLTSHAEQAPIVAAQASLSDDAVAVPDAAVHRRRGVNSARAKAAVAVCAARHWQPRAAPNAARGPAAAPAARRRPRATEREGPTRGEGGGMRAGLRDELRDVSRRARAPAPAGPAPTGAEARPARRRERGGVASPTAVAAGGRAGPGLPASGPAWEELEKLVQGL